MWVLLAVADTTGPTVVTTSGHDNIFTVIVALISAMSLLLGNLLLRRRRNGRHATAVSAAPIAPAVAPVVAQNVVSRLEEYLENRIVELENETASLRSERDTLIARLTERSVELARAQVELDGWRNRRLYGPPAPEGRASG